MHLRDCRESRSSSPEHVWRMHSKFPRKKEVGNRGHRPLVATQKRRHHKYHFRCVSCFQNELYPHLRTSLSISCDQYNTVNGICLSLRSIAPLQDPCTIFCPAEKQPRQPPTKSTQPRQSQIQAAAKLPTPSPQPQA